MSNQSRVMRLRLAIRRSWKLRRYGIVSPTDFGAKADGIHDDTGAWIDAFHYIEQARIKPPRIRVRRGWSRLVDVEVPNGVTIEGT